MKRAITLCCLSFFLCACSSNHQSSAPIQGLTPSQVDKMRSENAKISAAKSTPVTADTRFAPDNWPNRRAIAMTPSPIQQGTGPEPQASSALCRLGVSIRGVKQYDDSIAIWKRYMTASGDAAFAYGNLGYCYELAGYPNLAESAYLNGDRKGPEERPCRTNYGFMLARQGQIEEAVRQWDSVLTEAQIHYNLASIYQVNGRKAGSQGGIPESAGLRSDAD